MKKTKYTRCHKDIYSELNEQLNGSNSLDALNIGGVNANKTQPISKGQVNLKVTQKVYKSKFHYVVDASGANASQMTSAYSSTDTTALAIGSVPAFLKTLKFPVMLFGQNDSAGGYKVAYEKLPSLPSTVIPLGYRIVGANDAPLSVRVASSTSSPLVTAMSIKSPFSVINGSAVKGDMVFTYLCSEQLTNGLVENSGSGQYSYSQEFYLVDIIINCDSLAYGSLLNETSSDKFFINYIRYTLPSETNLAQFDENILLLKSGLFGADVKDQLLPRSFKDGSLYEKNIVNIAISKGIDKHNILGTTITATNESFTWIVFIGSFDKA